MIRLESPYLLLQEIYNEHPWRVLVCCIMLNCTSRKQVDRVRDEFFRRYPDPNSVVSADLDQIAELISPLGFRNRRANTIKRFSSDWLTLKWREPKELYGVGKYAQDSWDIFYKGDLSVEPTDGVLKKYLEWARQQEESPILCTQHCTI
jgi:methyl-CpG-binding domain protein 4